MELITKQWLTESLEDVPDDTKIFVLAQHHIVNFDGNGGFIHAEVEDTAKMDFCVFYFQFDDQQESSHQGTIVFKEDIRFIKDYFEQKYKNLPERERNAKISTEISKLKWEPCIVLFVHPITEVKLLVGH